MLDCIYRSPYARKITRRRHEESATRMYIDGSVEGDTTHGSHSAHHVFVQVLVFLH